MKVKIITPVHVSSGETNDGFAYRYINDYEIAKYKFIDMLTIIQDPEVLLNNNLLFELKSKKRKDGYAKIFRNLNFNLIKPEYKLKNVFNDIEDTEEVYSHIRNIEGPYIPGSSIKGNLMTAIMYDYAKKNFDVFKAVLQDNIDNNKKKYDFNTLISSIYSKKYKTYIDNNLLNSFSACFECEDIQFKDLGLYLAERFGSKDDKVIPVGLRECIEINQISESSVFNINLNKAKLLNVELDSNKQYQLKQLLNSYLDKDLLLNLMFEYTNYMLKEELKNHEIKTYENGILLPEVNKLINNKNIIRIGNSTNYWFKSITKLIKDNDLDFYEKHFDKLFKSGKSNKFTMPKTRVIYYGDKDTLPGYIEITK